MVGLYWEELCFILKEFRVWDRQLVIVLSVLFCVVCSFIIFGFERKTRHLKNS